MSDQAIGALALLFAPSLVVVGNLPVPHSSEVECGALCSLKRSCGQKIKPRKHHNLSASWPAICILVVSLRQEILF